MGLAMLPRSHRQAERDRRRRIARRHAAAPEGGVRLGLALERLEARRLLVADVGDTTIFSLGGTTPSDGVGDTTGEYDQVVVAGEAILDGTIAVQLAPGYVPRAGDRFTIMTYQSVVGTYDAGRGFFGLAGDLWFEIEQTGNATTAGAVTLVAREVLAGFNSDLEVHESDGAIAATIRDTIGTFLNRDYFGGDLQVTFEGGFAYGELDLQGTVVLRCDQDPAEPVTIIDAAVTGTATVGESLVASGVFLASFGIGEGATNGLELCGQAVDLDVAIGGATFAATDGRIGLLASDAGVAFEAAASISTNLSSSLTLRADEITISYNATAVDSTGKQVAAGAVSYTFGTLPANTFSIGVSGGELIAGGFIQVAGSFAVGGGTQGITLSDGTTMAADVLTIGGTALSGFAGSGMGTAAPAGVTIMGAAVGAALVTEKGGQGRRWLTVNGSGQSASLSGITGVGGSLTSVSLGLNLDAADGSVVDYAPGKTSLAVPAGGTVSVTLSADGSKGRGVYASGTAALAVNTSLSLAGSISIGLEGTSLFAVGDAISAQFGAVDSQTSLKVTAAAFGLLANGGDTAFELQGGLSASIAGFATVTGNSAVARYTSADAEIKAGRKLGAGEKSYEFAKDIGKGTDLLAVEGFEATVADFVTLSGDVGFRKTADALVAVGTNVTATLAVSQQKALSLTAGRLRLSVSGGDTSFEVRDFTVDPGATLAVAGISLDVAASFDYRDDTFRLGVDGSLALAGDTVTIVNGELWWANGRFTRITGSIEGKLLTANAWIPVDISGISVTLPASDVSTDIVLEVTGSIDRGRLQQNLRQLSGSDELAIGISVFRDGDWRSVADGDTFSFAVGSTGGRLWSTDVRPLRVDIQQLVVGLAGSTSGTGIAAHVSGSIAFGGLDSAGNLVPMSHSLPSPYGGSVIAGSLSITAEGIAGTVSLGGSWSADTGRLLLEGVAGLSGDFSVLGVAISGAATGSFRWEIGVDASGPIADGRSLPVIDSIQAEDLRFVIPNVARFDIGAISYVNAPQPGMPFATATNVKVTALGLLESLGLTGTLASLELYDDVGADRIIDGVSVVGLELKAAAGCEWIHEEGGRPLLSARDLVATWSNVIYRPAKPDFTTTGRIQLSADDLKVFPDKDGPFDLAVASAQGSIDLGTGAVSLSVGSFTMGFGANPRVDVAVTNVSLAIDDDPATDLFAVDKATVKLVDKGGTLSRLSFDATGLRFNIVAGASRLGVGGVTFTAGQGVLHAIGLAGFLPFDVTSAALAFGETADGYSDLTNFTLDVGGFFDLAALEKVLPFRPVVSIGGNPAGQMGSENRFDFGITFDAAAGLFAPRSLSNLVVGFRDWKVGEFAFAGQIGIAGYADGVFDGTVSGSVGIDRESPRNKVQASGGTGVDLYGASITLTGSVSSSAGVTKLVADADAESRFDLRFGDFLSISDLSFRFGFDITADADFAADPLNRVALTPRLESLAVGSITAGIGDYLQFGATADAQGAAGLSINLDPQGDEPLATMNVQVSSPLIGLSGRIDGFRLLQGGVPDFDGIGRIDVSVVSRGDGSESLLQNLLSFLPLSVTQVGLKFAPEFFKADEDGHRLGIADTTAFNLIVSGQVGTPSWLPKNFPFKAKSGFSGLEVDVRKLLRGDFAIVDLAGLSFDVGIDFGTVKVGGAITVGMVDADPTAGGVANVYYLAIGGDVTVAGYGFTGSIVLTTAGPVAATVAVPLAVPLGPTGFLISGVAGTLQFATATLPDPKDIKSARDLGQIPNPIDRDLTSPEVVEGVIQGLWNEQSSELRATWDLPATLAIRGILTHVAVAGMASGSVTLAANVALPRGDVSAPQSGLAFLGFGSVDVYGYSFVDARVLFDLRDALNPSFGFLIQAPSSTNPLGVLLPVKADFGVLVKTDGLAIATAVGMRSFVQKFVAGTLGESQAFFGRVIDRLFTIVKTTPDRSAVASRLAAMLPAGTTLASLDRAAFGTLLDDVLDLDDLLAALGTGKAVADLAAEQQAALDAKLSFSKALLDDVLAFGADALGPEFTADQVMQAFARVLRSAVAQAIQDVDAFVRSDSFDPRIVIEGALQPSLFGLPVGDPVSSASASFSKKGVFVTLDAPILPLLSSLSALPGFNAVGGASTLLAVALAQAGLVEMTTLGLELPFDGIDTQRVLDGLADGTPPLAAFNPLGPDWGVVVNTRLNSITGLGGVGLSMLQVSPGSPLVGRSLQLLPDLGAPFDPRRIPVSQQSIVDRLTADGGTLLTGTAFASRLITDPLSVIADVIAAKNALGGVLDAGLSLDTLAKAFSSGAEFLQTVGDAISRPEELARLQAYLPITFGDLLPAGLVDMANDPGRFADEYRTAFFNADGSIKATAVQDALDRLDATLSARRDLAARGPIIDGVLNGKFLGVQFAEGRVTVDPSRPSAMVVEGRVPILGNLQVKGVVDGGSIVLPPAPEAGSDPYAGLRSIAGGDVLPIPRAMIEASFGTAATGEETDFDRLMRSVGLDPGWFKLDVTAQASLRGYTPAYDLTSIDPVKRVGGFELKAGLDIPNFVDNASFQFQMSMPQPKDSGNPAAGTYIPFSGIATADWFGIRIDARDIASKLFGGSRDAWYYAPLGLLSIDQGIEDVSLALHNDAQGTTFTAAGTFDIGAIVDVVNSLPFVHVDTARQQRLSFTFDVTDFKILDFGLAEPASSPLDVFLSSAAIAENATPGTVVGEFGFFDSAIDTSSLRYDLVAGEGDADNARFRIAGTTLETVGPFDATARPTLTIRVQVTDGKSQTVAKAITISVANVNESPTSIELSAVTVAENQPLGTVVGTLSTTDPDAGETFTYALVAGVGAADNAAFTIVGGQLRTGASFNFEAKSGYSVRISSRDQGGLTTEKAFTISVTDVAELPAAPRIVMPKVFTVVEDTPTALAFSGTPFVDQDSSLSTTMTVTVTVSAGVIAATGGSGVTVGGTSMTRTFTGTLQSLNDFFTATPGRIVYTPVLNSTVARTLAVSIVEKSGVNTLSSTASAALQITPVDDAPILAAQPSFIVKEDTATNFVWSKSLRGFVDVDSPVLTVTLDVPDGVLSATSTRAVAVSGSSTHRVFSGSPANLTAYFRKLGSIVYTPARDNTVARTLTTTVSDGTSQRQTTSSITIRPISDAPRIRAAASLAGIVVKGGVEITYDALKAASGASAVDSPRLSLVIQAVHAGSLQRWNGTAWVGIAAASPAALRTLSVGQKLRWTPPAKAVGALRAFTIKATDGRLLSATTCTVSVSSSGTS